jgi:hypothetical protein
MDSSIDDVRSDHFSKVLTLNIAASGTKSSENEFLVDIPDPYYNMY